MLSNGYKQKALNIINDSFESFLNFQAPWGEWERGFFEYEDHLKTIERLRSEAHKPNMSRTLRALELINKFSEFNKKNKNLYELKKNLAMKWIRSQFHKSPFFKSWIEIGRDFRGDRPQFVKINDIRHTIQALIAIWKHNENEFFTQKYRDSITYIFEYINYNNRNVNKYAHNKDRECFSYFQGIDGINCMVTTLWAINFFGIFRDEIQAAWIKRVIGDEEENVEEVDDMCKKLKYALNSSISYLNNKENFFSYSDEKLDNIYFYSACVFRVSSLLNEFKPSYLKEMVDFISQDYSDGKFIQDDTADGVKKQMDGYNIAVIHALIRAKQYVEIPASRLNHTIERLIDEYFEIRKYLNTPDFMNIVNILLEVSDYKNIKTGQNFQDYLIPEELSEKKRDEVVKWQEGLLENSQARIKRFQGRVKVNGYKEIIKEESIIVNFLEKHINILKGKKNFKKIYQIKAINRTQVKTKIELYKSVRKAT